MKKTSVFEKFATSVTKATGSTPAFLIAVAVIIVWGITGPVFHFSNTWQLIINTGTTIITFLMVFLIQKTQNKDSMAIQLKLNELIASSNKASNRIVDIEDLTEEELNTLKKYYITLSELAKKDKDARRSHTIEDAIGNHEEKKKASKKIDLH